MEGVYLRPVWQLKHLCDVMIHWKSSALIITQKFDHIICSVKNSLCSTLILWAQLFSTCIRVFSCSLFSLLWNLSSLMYLMTILSFLGSLHVKIVIIFVFFLPLVYHGFQKHFWDLSNIFNSWKFTKPIWLMCVSVCVTLHRALFISRIKSMFLWSSCVAKYNSCF